MKQLPKRPRKAKRSLGLRYSLHIEYDPAHHKPVNEVPDERARFVIYDNLKKERAKVDFKRSYSREAMEIRMVELEQRWRRGNRS